MDRRSALCAALRQAVEVLGANVPKQLTSIILNTHFPMFLIIIKTINYFYPTGRLLDALSGIIRTPTFDETESQYAQPT